MVALNLPYLLGLAAFGMPQDFDPKVCLWEYKQGWDSEAVSKWGASWIAKTIDAFVAEISKRMAWRGSKGPG